MLHFGWKWAALPAQQAEVSQIHPVEMVLVVPNTLKKGNGGLLREVA